MNKISIGLSILLVLLFQQSSHSQINPDSVKISTVEISKGLYEIRLYGGNLLLSVGTDGVMLIDASYKELSDKLKSEIRKIDARPLKYLVNTHWHFDHAGGNLLFGKESTIIAHEYTRNLLSQDKELLGEKLNAHPNNVLPQITFFSEMTLRFNSDTIQLIAMPGGHTGGDILVYFKKAKILHVGDIVFSDIFPFCDIDNGGNVLMMAEIIQKIVKTFPKDITIIPGHGRPYSIEDIIKYREMIISTSNIVRNEIKKEKTLDEIKKADVLKNWKGWALAFTCDEWIEMIYKSDKKQTAIPYGR
jgi:glyoxylase-like metal-dependent hydrolase (beta-lactamase superfamily II)